MTRNFCDVCDKPAIDSTKLADTFSFRRPGCKTYRGDDYKAADVAINVTHEHSNKPMDICKECLVVRINKILEQL